MLGTWVLGTPLILAFGTIGFAIANLCVNSTNLILYRVVQAHLSFRILPMIVPAWCVATVIGLAAYFVMHFTPPTGLAGLGICFALGLSAYTLCMLGTLPLRGSQGLGLGVEPRHEAPNIGSHQYP